MLIRLELAEYHSKQVWLYPVFERYCDKHDTTAASRFG